MKSRCPWCGKDVATESRLWAGPDKQTQSGSWKRSCLRQGFLLVELTSTADCRIQTSSGFSVCGVKSEMGLQMLSVPVLQWRGKVVLGSLVLILLAAEACCASSCLCLKMPIRHWC